MSLYKLLISLGSNIFKVSETILRTSKFFFKSQYDENIETQRNTGFKEKLMCSRQNPLRLFDSNYV